MQTLRGQLPHATTQPSPQITCWPAKGNSLEAGLIIFPGGAYGHLAEHEGAGYAQHFSQAGITCFVVTYRLGTQGFRHPAMLEDALAAIATVRTQASQWGIQPDRIGVMGSSAGGHLAAHALTAWNQVKSEVSLRPNFGVLCYPVISSQGQHANSGSIANLLGDHPTLAQLEEVSCDKRVTQDTPPCFLWHTGEDLGVPMENSLMFASALREHGVPFELHLYANGGHGLGLNAPFPWAQDCVRWITQSALAQSPTSA